ncbi:hypothetical protein LZD49_33425 [Dyadobacter sp. CY261]|uniref:hypothetical protein n=1 Tax=Dyadobacter sp. CY261 TaxID=2907203 RepID=UPI001F3A07C6|nr:hypothetical protein [Dyadobacter sp. CY261]MCF0075428.1 hypothetical protein [Dyadobacter sp. CY261]
MDWDNQDFKDELTRQIDAMKAEFDWLRMRHPFSEKTAEMYYSLYNSYQEKAFRDPEDIETSNPIEEEVAQEAEKIFNTLKSSVIMDTIDEIRKRQEEEIGEMLEEQYKIWQDLRATHNGTVPDDVADEYRKASRLETFALEERHVEEREAIPFYGKVLATERALVTAMRGVHDSIEMHIQTTKDALEDQEEIDDMQDELERLLQASRNRGLSPTQKPS